MGARRPKKLPSPLLPRPTLKGARHKITNWDRFRAFVHQHGDKTQAQMAQLWGDNVPRQNISDALQKLGFSRKKTYGYRGRDEFRRQAFRERIESKALHQIVYVDAGIDNREEYPYGYCEVGQRFHAFKSGKRTERVSWIAALKEGTLLTYTGSRNRDLFESWLEHCLVP